MAIREIKIGDQAGIWRDLAIRHGLVTVRVTSGLYGGACHGNDLSVVMAAITAGGLYAESLDTAWV